MIVLVNSFFLRKNFTGIVIWPFVIVRNKRLKEDPVFMNHERIHLRQQLEMLVIPFYIWYVMEYTIRLIKYKNSYDAYKYLSFEREAYAHEKDLDYLKKRSFWGFRNYI
jgi:hypothetical protein